MKSSATLTTNPKAGGGHVALRLQSVRLRHMLDQAQSIIGLCADGQEKLTGAYIFDSHYIFSLVDRIIDLSREMVFDASVIAPEGIRTCYSAFDNCKAAAEALFLADSPSEEADAADAFEDTAEYRLLRQALDWIGGPADRPRVSVIGLLERVLRHVFAGLGKKAEPMPYLLEFACGGTRQRIAFVDMDGAARDGSGATASRDNLRCRPLALLLAGACPEGDTAPSPDAGTPARDWWALAGPEDVSLFSPAAEALTWLDADLDETGDSRHILFWSPAGAADLPDDRPHCRAALPSGEILLWKAAEEDNVLDRTLTALAGALFRPAGGNKA